MLSLFIVEKVYKHRFIYCGTHHKHVVGIKNDSKVALNIIQIKHPHIESVMNEVTEYLPVTLTD